MTFLVWSLEALTRGTYRRDTDKTLTSIMKTGNHSYPVAEIMCDTGRSTKYSKRIRHKVKFSLPYGKYLTYTTLFKGMVPL